MPKPKLPATVPDDDLWIMLLSTLRYSMGRRSYITCLCVDLILRYRDHLTGQQQLQIVQEVKKEQRINETCPGHLGDSCDVREWERLAKALEA